MATFPQRCPSCGFVELVASPAGAQLRETTIYPCRKCRNKLSPAEIRPYGLALSVAAQSLAGPFPKRGNRRAVRAS